MKLPAQSRFQRWKLIEVAKYVPSLDRVIREQTGPKDSKQPVIMEWEAIEEWRAKNNNLGLYTSVFHYDDNNLDKATRLGSLYFDLDSPDAEVALEDCRKLVEELIKHVPEAAIRIYFTGAKGFHVEGEAISLGIGPANDLPGIFRYIAGELRDLLGLSTLDFAVYDLRRMWRLPNSQHQKSGLFKVPLTKSELMLLDLPDILKLAVAPRDIEVPDQVFSAKANEWYRNWIYKKETKTYSTDELISRFNKFGSGVLRKVDDSELEFDPKRLFDGCPAILRLWEKAEKEHDLSHEARLFLCSILTYSEEAEWYLHEILKHCDDYNVEKSTAHINDWKKRRELGIGGRPYSCDRANSAGVGCGDCHLEAKKKWEVVGDRMIETGEMAQPSPIRYGYRRKDK